MERRFQKRPGFDCRNGNCPACAGGRRGDHGICSDRWIFTAIKEGVGAITHVIYTPFYPPTVNTRGFADRDEFRSHGFDICLAWPTDDNSIAAGVEPQVCEYIGKCYAGEALSLLYADKFMQERFTSGYAENQSEFYWRGLEELLEGVIDKETPYRSKERCVCCDGKGVVEKQ